MSTACPGTEPGGEDRLARMRRELLGAVFTTAKDLRHQAEATGFLFVRVETVDAEADHGHWVLRPGERGELHVHAERAQPWHPYRVTRIEEDAHDG